MEEHGDSPLGRAVRIVEVLAASPQALTLTQISAAAELGMTTAHRQLTTLVGLGLVEKASGKTFVVGERTRRLAALLAQGRDVAVMAEPILRALADRFGETAFLARLDGTQVQLVASALPDAGGQAYAQPGRDMPLHAAASGKILLALQDDSFVDRYLATERLAYTPATRVDAESIRADVALARLSNVAVCDNEFDPGILSYATAIRDPRTGEPYAVAVFGLKERFGQVSPATVEVALIAAAGKLGAALGAA